MKALLADKALHDATNQLQIMIFTREDTPIRDRVEAVEDLRLRLDNLSTLAPDGKKRWRAGLVELAAYALFAAASDE
jgi:hypothetical protein